MIGVNAFLNFKGEVFFQRGYNMIRKNGEDLVAGRLRQERNIHGSQTFVQLLCQTIRMGGEMQIEVVFQNGFKLHTQQTALGKDGALLFHAVAESFAYGKVGDHQCFAEEKSVLGASDGKRIAISGVVGKGRIGIPDRQSAAESCTIAVEEKTVFVANDMQSG